MEKFIQEQTDSLPFIEFNPINGTLLVKGKSIPEDPLKAYNKLMSLIEAYIENPATETSIEFEIEYINTSSVKWLFHILEKIEKIYVMKRHPVTFKFWYCDENVYEIGKYFKTNLAIPVLLIEKN